MKRRQYLIEHLKLIAMILEAREDGLIKRFVPVIVKKFDALSRNYSSISGHVSPYIPDRYRTDYPAWYSEIIPNKNESLVLARTAEGIIRFIIAMDPDTKATYSTWIVLMFAKGELNLEDLSRVFRALGVYTECKRRNLIPRSHDIGALKKPDALYDLVIPFQSRDGNEVVDTTYEAKMYQQSDILVDTPSVQMIHPKTQEAAQWFGRNTEWCTSYGGKYGIHKDQTPMYDSYAKQGPLYIITDKATGALYQFHRESESYMDAKDSRINISSFSQRFPEILHWFISRDETTRNRVGTVGDMVIYDTGESLEAIEGIGLTKIEARARFDYDNNRKLTNVYVAYNYTNSFRGSAEICAIMNAQGIHGGLNILSSLDLVYNESKKKYMSARDGGKLIWSDGEFSWIKIDDKDYRLYGSENDTSIYLQIHFPHSKNVFAVNVMTDTPDDEEFIFDMVDGVVRAIKNKNIEYYRHSPAWTTELRDPKQIALTKAYPGTADLVMDWTVNGDSPRFRKRVATVLPQLDRDAPEKIEFEGDSFTVRKFSSFADAIESLGNSTAKYAWGKLSGDSNFHDDYGSASSDDAATLLRSLKPDDRELLWDFIVKEAGLDPTEAENDYDDLEELYSDIGNSGVEAAIYAAYSDGSERGEENAMSKSLWSEIASSGLRSYITTKWDHASRKSVPVKPRWDESIDIDAPCAVLVSLSDYLRELAKGDPSDYWDGLETPEIKLEEPHYYGWQDYDEEAAKESFPDRLRDNGVI